jgi:N-acetylneuraminic acid mutarotase
MTNTWQTLAPYPGATNPYGIMAAVYNDKIYTFYEKKTYEYDPADNTWTQKADIPTSKRTGSAEIIDGKIYIVSSIADYKLHIYDPLLDTWSTGPNLPISSHYGEATVLAGKLYILGGTSGDHGTHKQVHVYDSCSKSWRRITDMASVRAVHNVSAVQ